MGKTLLCVALASMLVKRGYKVALVDLTLRLGSDLAVRLGLQLDPDFCDLLPVMDTIDPRTLKAIYYPTRSGLRLPAAPRSPDRWQRIKERSCGEGGSPAALSP